MGQVKKVLQHAKKTVSAGDVLNFDIPKHGTIDDIILDFRNSGEPAARTNIEKAISKISLAIDGKQIINCPISHLFKLYDSLGVEVTQKAAGVIGLNIGRYLFKDPNNEDFFAYGTADVQVIQLQVYCAAETTNVTEVGVSTLRRPSEQVLGSYIKVINYPQNQSGTGYSDIDTLPRDSNDGYLQVMAIGGAGAKIAGGECSVNSNPIFDEMTQAENDYILRARGLGPVEGVFNYSFTDGSIKGFLPMSGVTDLRFKTNFAAKPTNNTYDLLAVSITNVPQQMIAAVSR